jgi:hypothetical protein
MSHSDTSQTIDRHLGLTKRCEDEPLEITQRSGGPVAVGAEPHASSEPLDWYLELDSSCETSENVYRDNPQSPVSSKILLLYEHHTIYPTFLLKEQCASELAFARLADIWWALELFGRTLWEWWCYGSSLMVDLKNIQVLFAEVTNRSNRAGGYVWELEARLAGHEEHVGNNED